VEPLIQPSLALFDRLEDVREAEACEPVGEELGGIGPELSASPEEASPVDGVVSGEGAGESFPSRSAIPATIASGSWGSAPPFRSLSANATMAAIRG
jgi:hypothetical protein